MKQLNINTPVQRISTGDVMLVKDNYADKPFYDLVRTDWDGNVSYHDLNVISKHDLLEKGKNQVSARCFSEWESILS